jgi:2-octaprenyl-3-methyl-6-methoxy-1,4-benzoquinol hydroxylase
MAEQYDVVIVGGGMVGAMLACALGDSIYRVAVLEARDPEPFGPEQPCDLRVSAISRASQRMFEAVGAWQAMLAMRAAPYRRMLVWDGEAGGETLFDSGDIAEPTLGHIIENRIIQLALRERLLTFDNVDYLCPTRCESLHVDPEAAKLTLDDGRELEAKLVVGADGANSRVRELAGIGHSARRYGHDALVATVDTMRPQQDITWQRFVPSGPEALLPLPGSRASLVWYNYPDEVERLLGLSEDEFIAEIEAKFPERLGGLRKVVSRGSFPLIRRHAERYVQPRVVLVGDAAHTIHPLAGQGVNLGLMDAAVLAEILLTAEGRRFDPGELRALRRYERWRSGHNHATQSAMDLFYHLFKPQPTPVRVLRSMALNFANRMPLIKNFCMRYAMGLSGDLPSLARGRVPRAS